MSTPTETQVSETFFFNSNWDHVGAGAEFDSTNAYRYLLWRRWEAFKPLLGWVMLNPSTADGLKDDATIRRCRGFAQRDGYGGILVANLYAYRATDPKDLARAGWPVGDANAEAIRRLAAATAAIVCAWGAHATLMTQAHHSAFGAIAPAGKPVWCLGRTKYGAPVHPLRISKARPFEAYA